MTWHTRTWSLNKESNRQTAAARGPALARQMELVEGHLLERFELSIFARRLAKLNGSARRLPYTLGAFDRYSAL